MELKSVYFLQQKYI